MDAESALTHDPARLAGHHTDSIGVLRAAIGEDVARPGKHLVGPVTSNACTPGNATITICRTATCRSSRTDGLASMPCLPQIRGGRRRSRLTSTSAGYLGPMKKLMLAALVGAAAMWFYDPANGPRRRDALQRTSIGPTPARPTAGADAPDAGTRDVAMFAARRGGQDMNAPTLEHVNETVHDVAQGVQGRRPCAGHRLPRRTQRSLDGRDRRRDRVGRRREAGSDDALPRRAGAAATSRPVDVPGGPRGHDRRSRDVDHHRRHGGSHPWYQVDETTAPEATGTTAERRFATAGN